MKKKCFAGWRKPGASLFSLMMYAKLYQVFEIDVRRLVTQDKSFQQFNNSPVINNVTYFVKYGLMFLIVMRLTLMLK